MKSRFVTQTKMLKHQEMRLSSFILWKRRSRTLSSSQLMSLPISPSPLTWWLRLYSIRWLGFRLWLILRLLVLNSRSTAKWQMYCLFSTAKVYRDLRKRLQDITHLFCELILLVLSYHVSEFALPWKWFHELCNASTRWLFRRCSLPVFWIGGEEDLDAFLWFSNGDLPYCRRLLSATK